MEKIVLEPTPENIEIYYPESKVLISFHHRNGHAEIMFPACHGAINRYPFMIGAAFHHKFFEIYRGIFDSRTFAINMPDARLAGVVKKCEEIAGQTGDKFKALGLTMRHALRMGSPIIEECVVNAELQLRQLWRFGDYDFIGGELLMAYNDEAMDLDKTLMDWKGPDSSGPLTIEKI